MNLKCKFLLIIVSFMHNNMEECNVPALMWVHWRETYFMKGNQCIKNKN